MYCKLWTVDVSLKVQQVTILELLRTKHVLAFVRSYKLPSIDNGCNEDEYTTEFKADVLFCYPIRMKGKIVSVCAVNVYGEVEVSAQSFLNSALLGCVVSFMTRPFYLRRKSSLGPLCRSLGGPQILFGRFGADAKSRNSRTEQKTGHFAKTQFHHDLGFHAEIRLSRLHQNFLRLRVALWPWKYAIIFTRYSTVSFTGHFFTTEKSNS